MRITEAIDSPHLRDINGACAGCGARWVLEEGHRSYFMEHKQPCPYLEAEEYGAETEIGPEA